ncbi:MAG: GerW family sporulation protein [Oscillospiraceae bacterium]|nr:GerW family sporulation protein [Oscillospiraceae bacterium]
MKDQSAAGILTATIEKVRQLVDVSTIIGDPIKVSDALTIIPVSKVTYGFASGGTDFPSKSSKELFGGGGGAGVTINPVAFIVVKDGEVSLKHITSGDNAAERAVSMVPEVIDKVTGLISKTKKNDGE